MEDAVLRDEAPLFDLEEERSRFLSNEPVLFVLCLDSTEPDLDLETFLGFRGLWATGSLATEETERRRFRFREETLIVLVELLLLVDRDLLFTFLEESSCFSFFFFLLLDELSADKISHGSNTTLAIRSVVQCKIYLKHYWLFKPTRKLIDLVA